MIQKKVLITGAGGFIGHHLARFLKNKGYKVYGTDIVKSPFSAKEDFDGFFIRDLKNSKNCLDVTKNIDHVYNLAAINGSIEMTTNNRAELIHNNVLVNANMAEACFKNKVKRIFFSSSACVYPIGLQNSNKIHPLKEDEDVPAEPDTEYGWEKLFSEHIWKSYEKDHGLEIRIARFFNVYGPEALIDTIKSKAPMALTKKVIEAGNNGEVHIWGDGKQKRSFVYIDDCVEVIWKLTESNIKVPVNIGTKDLVSINELVDIAANIEGIKVKKIHELNKIQGVRNRLPDLSRAHKLLNWKAEVSFRLGMAQINKFVHESLKK